MSSECTLRDYVSLVRGTTYKGDLVNLPGPVLLGLASIQSDGGFRWGAFKTYGGACPPKITLFPGDLYVSLKDVTQSGDLLGSVARVPKQIKSGRLTQDTVKLELSGRPINSSFLYWLLRTPQYRQFCRARATGTTTLGLAREDFLAFPISDPTPSQISLVELLEAIEARIEILGETNTTLEAIAQALFKSWFVDFDPVHANAGTQAPSLPAEIQALFPSRLVESPQGLIPDGWEVKKCSDIIDVRDGTHASPKASETGYPLLTSKHITSGELLFDGAYLISEADYLDISKRSKVDHLDVLITMIGTVGVTAFVLNESTDFAIKNIGLFKTSKRPEFASYMYLLLGSKEMKHYLEARMAGTTQKYLSLKALREIAIIEPAKPVIQAFSELVKPIFEKIHHNRTSVQTLSTVRDTLLPRLISGQLRLPEAEAALAEVV